MSASSTSVSYKRGVTDIAVPELQASVVRRFAESDWKVLQAAGVGQEVQHPDTRIRVTSRTDTAQNCFR
jgi:hypothetical protein